MRIPPASRAYIPLGGSSDRLRVSSKTQPANFKFNPFFTLFHRSPRSEIPRSPVRQPYGMWRCYPVGSIIFIAGARGVFGVASSLCFSSAGLASSKPRRASTWRTKLKLKQRFKVRSQRQVHRSELFFRSLELRTLSRVESRARGSFR